MQTFKTGHSFSKAQCKRQFELHTRHVYSNDKIHTVCNKNA